MSGNTRKKQQHIYDEMVSFYDLAELMLDDLEDPTIEDPIAAFEEIQPIVEDIEGAIDLLTKEYKAFSKTKKQPTSERKKDIEDALGMLQISLEKYKKIRGSL